MEATFKTSGFKELDDILKTMPDKLARKALVKAVAAGARVVRDQAASNVHQPVSSLAISSKLGKKTGWRAQALLGPSTKKWYLMFKQTGTYWLRKKGGPKVGQMGKSGKIIKGMPATYFLTKAFDSKIYQAMDRMKEVLGDQIDK